MVKLCKWVLLVALICAFMMNSVCLAAEYTLSDPDTLEIGDVKDVVFINESIVFIDGQFYPYIARVGYFAWVSLSPSRALYEWDYVAKKGFVLLRHKSPSGNSGTRPVRRRRNIRFDGRADVPYLWLSDSA